MIIATENPLSNRNIKLYLCSFDNEGVRLFYIFIFFYLNKFAYIYKFYSFRKAS